MKLFTLAVVAAFSIPTVLCQTKSAYVQAWTNSACTGTTTGAETVAADGQTCSGLSSYSAIVQCNTDNSWTINAYLNGNCGGNTFAFAAGTSPTECQPVSVLGIKVSIKVDCTNQGANNSTPAPTAAAAVVSTNNNNTCFNAVPHAGLPLGYCAQFYAKNLTNPRGLIYDTNISAVVTVEEATGYIYALIDSNNNGQIDNTATERILLVNNSTLGLNHGIAYNSGYLYASSVSAVYRWPYNSTDLNTTVRSTATTVISGIPTGGHNTRTIKFSPDKQYLYINVGSEVDVDPSIIPNRQQVKRFNVSDLIAVTNTTQPLDYSTTGEVFAQGVRDEVALGFDPYGNLVGGMNGNDNLYRVDLGGDLSINNPGVEIDVLLESNIDSFYGYPYCWSEYQLPYKVTNGTGSQWGMPYFTNGPYEAGSLTTLLNTGVVPDFYPAPPTFTNFTFPGLDASIEPGQVIDLATTQIMFVNVSFPTNTTDYYTFIIYDRDASSRWNPNLSPYAHAAYINIPGSNTSVDAGVAAYPFTFPAPPAGTGYHRYTNAVYRQNSGNWTLPSSFSNANRINWNYTAFLQELSGSQGYTQVSGNMFLTQNQTGEPAVSISNYTKVPDIYCRNTTAVVPPSFILPPHTAPQGLLFYNATGQYAFPNTTGQLFVTAYGSYNGTTPIGYRLFQINVTYPNSTNSSTTLSATLNSAASDTTEQYGNFTGYSSFFYYANNYNVDTDINAWPYKPVDVVTGTNGELYISSDVTGDVIVIKYIGQSFNQSALPINSTMFDQSRNYTFANSTVAVTNSSYTTTLYKKLKSIVQHGL